MSSEDPQPFINNSAYYKETNSYVPFPSQSDAMLASLQLFHEVPCRIMNLIISTVTHPDFDAKQVTLKSSLDVIKVTEEARLQDRMAVVHRRSLNADGHMEQTKLPHFALHEVLDIIHAERLERIRSIFVGPFYDDEYDEETSQFNKNIPEDDVLSNMSLVHRSWTFPAQQTLGRLLCIRKPKGKTGHLSHVEHKVIFGPWTTAVAIFFAPHYPYRPDGIADVEREVIEFGFLKKFEILHRLLLSSPNLKRIYIRSDIPLLTTWSNFTVREMLRQNTHLEELTLQTMSTHWSQIPLFDLDPILEYGNVTDNLQFLSIQGTYFSDRVRDSLSEGSSFARLRSLSIGNTEESAASKTLLTLLSVLSARSDPHLNSLSIFGDHYPTFYIIEKDLSPRQCAFLFEHLTTLHIDSDEADFWLRWISPYTSRLETITFTTTPYSALSYMLTLLPPTTQILDFRIRNASGPHQLEQICLCVEALRRIARSTRPPALKLVALSLPGVRPLNYEPEVKATIEVYEARIRGFCTEMNAECGDAGIKFVFSWSERCDLLRFVQDSETSSDETSSAGVSD